MVDTFALEFAGYQLGSSQEYSSFYTASGEIRVPLVEVQQFEALGQTKENFIVAAHTIPNNSAIDGLIGLDFLKAFDLRINFKNSMITLS